jgi:hypothetical protein
VESVDPQQLAVTLDGKLENGQLQATLQLDPATAAVKGRINASACRWLRLHLTACPRRRCACVAAC